MKESDQNKIAKNKPNKKELIPSGIYRATLDKVEDTTSKAGRSMFTLYWRINKGDYDGRIIRTFIVKDSEKAKNLMKVLAVNMGYDCNTDVNNLIGDECRIQIIKKDAGFGNVNSVEYFYSIFEE